MCPPREITVAARANYEVNMIRHDASADDGQIDVVVGFGHEPQEFGVVPPAVKEVCAVIATIDYVVTKVGNDGASGTGHAAKRTNSIAADRSENRNDPRS
jgi:hypothetical protein